MRGANEVVSDWKPAGYRVRWLKSPEFVGQSPEECERVVESSEDVLETLHYISRRKPCTERRTYAPQVFALQERTERREVPVGISGWGN